MHISDLRNRIRLGRRTLIVITGSSVLLLAVVVMVIITVAGRSRPSSHPTARVNHARQPTHIKTTHNSSKVIAPPTNAQTGSGQISIHGSNQSGSTIGNVLFSDALNGSDRIVTNEYVHWNPNSGCPHTSNTWDMTSGTLFVKGGIGYSGIPTTERQSVCDSYTHTNSAVFRLNTKQSHFANVKVSLDYLPVAHTGDGANTNSYDGIHVWLGYQNEYSLYAASIFRWDKTLVIKKKVPTATTQCMNPSNDGCYYDITPAKQYPALTAANTWHHTDVTINTISASQVTVSETVDGNLIAMGTDNAMGGPVYSQGAVGIRADNTEFYFKNFTVTSLR